MFQFADLQTIGEEPENNMFDDYPKDINSVIREGYRVTSVEYVNQGWEIFKQNAGGFIGFLLLYVLIGFALALVTSVIPAGNLISSIITIPLSAGFIIVAFKILKQQETTFNDFFQGFQNGRFGPLVLTALISGLIIAFCFLIPVIVIAGGVMLFTHSSIGSFAMDSSASPSPIFTAILLAATFLALVPVTYLSVAYTFAIPFVIDRRLQFWEAMETSRKVITKRWFSFAGFLSLLFLLNLVGTLLCFVGLIITAPLTSCAIVAAYRDIVGLNASSEMAL